MCARLGFLPWLFVVIITVEVEVDNEGAIHAKVVGTGDGEIDANMDLEIGARITVPAEPAERRDGAGLAPLKCQPPESLIESSNLEPTRRNRNRNNGD